MRRAPCPRRRIASLKMCSTFPLVFHKCAEAAGTQAVVPPAFQRMSVVHEIHVLDLPEPHPTTWRPVRIATLLGKSCVFCVLIRSPWCEKFAQLRRKSLFDLLFLPAYLEITLGPPGSV